MNLQRLKDLQGGAVLTIQDFFDSMSPKLFQQPFLYLRNFARGLPTGEELQDPDTTAVFKELLIYGSIKRRSREVENAISICNRHGWIHSDMVSEYFSFTLPSPLHGMYVSWRLIPEVMVCPFVTVQDMTFTIIKTFKPSQLSLPSRMGEESTNSPTEARYHFEFYCGAFEVTEGGVQVCPEFLSAAGELSGRINLFIPGKKWGIELMREGNRLAEHDLRFGPFSAYGVWLDLKDMEDYIILDCRTSMPNEGNPRKVTFLISNNSWMTDELLQKSKTFSMLYLKTNFTWSLSLTMSYGQLRGRWHCWRISVRG
jgi:hypothetical protein